MNKIFRFFAKRHMLATMFTIIVLVIGIMTVVSIRRDLFPRVQFDQVAITTIYPGASPEDVELNVTNRIEKEISVIDGVDKVTSISIEDMSSITVYFDPNLNKVKMNNSIQEVKEAASRVQRLPKGIQGQPIVSRLNFSEFPIIEIGIKSNKKNYRELREQARILEKKLKELDGVGKIIKSGYNAREVKVNIQPKKLEKYQVPITEILTAIQMRNIRSSGGTLESYTGDKNIVSLAQFKSPKEVGEVIVRSNFEGYALKVKDFAKIEDTFKKPKSFSRINGKKMITLSINKKESADIITTVNKIRSFMKSKNSGLSDDIEVYYSSDLSRYVKASFDVVFYNGLAGFILVIVVLTLFLNFRTSIWVAMGIPVSLLGAIALLPLFNITLDVITLTGLILVLGIVVDDAIIVAETIYSKWENGDSPVDAAVNGLNEVFFPVLTTIFTTFLAFLPMFLIPGDLGKFIFVIPLIIILALSISLIEGIVSLPAHVIHGFDKSKRSNNSGRKWFIKVKKRYEIFMNKALNHRYKIVSSFVVVLIGSVLYASTMSFDAFPSEGAEEFAIYIETPRGTTLNNTSKQVKAIEKSLEKIPKNEIATYTTVIGNQLGELEESNLAMISVDLAPFSERDRTADQIVGELRELTRNLKGFKKLRFDVNESGPSPDKPISLKIVGADDKLRIKLANDIEKYLKEIDGVVDISRDDPKGKQQVEIIFNFEKLASYGLTVADVAQTVRLAYDGEVATRVQYGHEEVDFKVQILKSTRKNTTYLKNLVVPNNVGRLIKLGSVAKLKIGPGPSNFKHLNRGRTINIQANVILSKIKAIDVPNMVLDKFDISKNYPGIILKIEGEAKKQKESMGNSAKTFVIAIIGIYFLLILLFNSFKQPLLVLSAVPFGMVGVIIIFALHSEPFSFMALLGIIGLSGVVVNDSLVLVDHLNRKIKNNNDKTITEVIAAGSADRLRAILMTTITTAAGLLPLAYGIGGEDPTTAPMALALGWGLIFATPLTLVLLPSLYVIGDDIKKIKFKKNFKFNKTR